jgi:hypothetical protein
MPEKLEEKYPDMERLGFLEEVHQKKGAQSAPQTLMDRRFERPNTSVIYVHAIYPPLFCIRKNLGCYRDASGN